TTGVFTLTDTAGAGLDFGAVTSAGAFTCNAADPLICTLPAGTAVGTYSLTYTAVVNASATGTVTNAVVGTGGGEGNPACSGTCDTSTTVTSPAVTYAKSANVTEARVGDTIEYSLTATVTNSPTTDIVTLTDTPGAGLDFTAVINAGAFACNAEIPLVCTLPAGTAVGTYSLTYAAVVNATASNGSVTNAVVGTGGGGGNPTCSGVCDTNTPLIAPEVIFAKTASTAGPVKAGDVITYTLTTTIANSKTTSDVVLLTDTLGTGIDFTAVTSAGAYGVDASGAPVVRFTLPAGTGPGTYAVSYTATVNDQASGSVSNVVVGSGPDNPVCTTACGTDTSVKDPVVTYHKSVSAPGATVKVGDTLSYTLTATVADAATTDIVTLTDTPGAGLDFTAVTIAGAFTCNAASPLVCTLPAGTAVGSYSLTYTATVNATASGTVTNAVVGSGGGGGNPACSGACDTSTIVTPSTITYGKTTSATNAKVGDILTFTLTATVADAATDAIFTLTDTPGAGLDFTAVTSAGAFTCNAASPLVCTLPARTAVGTYSLTYTATVNATASGSVTNAVVGTGGGGGNPACAGACDTDTPLVAPEVIFAKTASTAGPVKAGDVITYTLTTTIANSKTTSDVVLLTDTLGTGIDFTAVTSAGAYGVDASGAPVVRFTLPAGTGPGTYAVSYTATVNERASGTVSNAVVGSGTDNPVCTKACGTETNVIAPAVTYAKSANVAQAKVGDTIEYSLIATVTNSPTTDVVTLTDTPGMGLDFTAVTSAGAFTCNAASPLICTLPAGTPTGTYSLTYSAVVNASASNGSVTNAVVGTGGGGGNPTCSGACGTNTPLVAPEVVFAKSASTAGPVKAGDVITYTLTTTIANSKTTSDVVLLTDTLGTGIDFTAVTSAGLYTVDASGAPVVRFTLPAGTGPGTYAVSYTATVNDRASETVSNVVVGSGTDNPTCTTGCGTETNVIVPTVTYAKNVDATQAKVGDTLTYTLTATVADAPTIEIVALTDTLGSGLDFGAVTSAGAFTCIGAGPLVCTLPAGTAVGTYSLTYTATVNATATGSVTNAVVGTGGGGGNPACA
ncbi:MAG TPA: isopeptide-forming domain-containing fimbrial protein, partial [Microbacterium sp.]|nr:isopeptide-forming domain-containing fimbrial protein [Microbacterium sp.]